MRARVRGQAKTCALGLSVHRLASMAHIRYVSGSCSHEQEQVFVIRLQDIQLCCEMSAANSSEHAPLACSPPARAFAAPG